MLIFSAQAAEPIVLDVKALLSLLSAELSRGSSFHGWMQQLSHVLQANKQPLIITVLLLKKKKKALVYKIASHTYCLQGVERASFGARHFKGKPVPTCDVQCSVVGLALCLCEYLAEKLYSCSPVSGTLQKWGVDQVPLSFISGLTCRINRGFAQGHFYHFKAISLGKGCMCLRWKENMMLVLPCFSQAFLFCAPAPFCRKRD